MELRENQIGKVYLEEIDTLKGIAIFLVVLGHSIIYFPIDLHMNSICDFIFRWLSSVHMPLFFVVSGYCYSYGGDYKKYLVKKLKRLLIPYFIFNAIDIVPRYCLSAFVNRPRNLEESVKKIFFDGGEYWFLYVLFFIFVVFPYIDKMTKDSVYRKIVATIIIIGIYYFLPNFGIIKVMIYYCMYFAAGVITKKKYGNKMFSHSISKAKTLICLCTLTIVWLLLINIGNSYFNVLASIIGIATIVLFIQYDMVNYIFSRFGKYSLQLYLLNGFLLVISRTLIVTLLGVTNPTVIICFNMIIDFIFSYIIIKYVCERIKIVRFMMGML